MPNILYRQMGGYFGSNAGDCGVIIIGDLRILIDLGGRLKIHNETNQPAKYFFSRLLGIEEFTDRSAKIAAKKFREKTPASEMIVLISHFHEDHVAKGDLWSLLEYLGATVYHGDAIAAEGQAHKATLYSNVNNDRLHEVAVGFDPLIRHVNFTGHASVQIEVYFIVPEPIPGAVDDNHASLGFLIEITVGLGPRYRILSLGDMTPQSGNTAVFDRLRGRNIRTRMPGHPIVGQNYADVVKISHHGSSANIIGAASTCVDQRTTILCSGYTKRDTATLIQEGNNTWGTAQEKRILLDYRNDDAWNDVFLKEFGDMNYQNLKAGKWKIDKQFEKVWS